MSSNSSRTPLLSDVDRQRTSDFSEISEEEANPTNAAASKYNFSSPSLQQSSSEDNHEALRKKKEENIPPFVYTLTFLSAIGGFLFGYDTGVVSGAMILLKDDFRLNSLWQELVVSVTIAAAALFAMVGGYVVFVYFDLYMEFL